MKFANTPEVRFWIIIAVMVVIAAVGSVILHNKPVTTPTAKTTTLSTEQIEQKFEPLRQQYMQQRAKGEFDSLIKHAEALAQKYPDFAPGLLFVGQIYFDKGDLASAQTYIDKSLALDPKQGQVHLLAGNIALMQQNPKLAADHLSQAVAMEPSNAQYWLYLGQCYFTQKLWPEAQQCYEKACELDSDMTLAVNGIADCQVQQGKVSEAIFTIQKAIDQTPLSKRRQQVVYLRKQAKLLAQLGKPGDALVVMGKLTDVELQQPDITAEMAAYWEQLGEPGKAAALYEKQLGNDLRNWELAATAARWRIKAGDIAKAKQHLMHLQLINPDLPVIAALQKELNEKSVPGDTAQ